MRTSIALALTCGLIAPSALAETKLNAQKMTVDGLEVRNLSCTLKQGGMFALMSLVGALAKEKKALDACAPTGAAFAVEWAFSGGTVSAAKVARASVDGKAGCVEKALKAQKPTDAGTCTALVLTGTPAEAQKAADKLSTSK